MCHPSCILKLYDATIWLNDYVESIVHNNGLLCCIPQSFRRMRHVIYSDRKKYRRQRSLRELQFEVCTQGPKSWIPSHAKKKIYGMVPSRVAQYVTFLG